MKLRGLARYFSNFHLLYLKTNRSARAYAPHLSGSDGDTLAALGQSLALIEFDPQGNILTANAKFCEAIGYELSEIEGRHHRMFVEPAHARSAEDQEFWAKLARAGATRS